MASTVHGDSPPYPPPPGYSQASSNINLNGTYQAHSALNSFEGPGSIVSTPTPTPPASRHQPSGSYNLPYSHINGSFSQHNTPRHYHDLQPPMPQQQLPLGQKPQIYTAVYSGVPVYEMEVNAIAVMRRRKDSWLNATQILKVAGIDKGKRTKVLEKEILSGDHEKVQGGYGRYQGTWISYQRGVEFARQYGVEELLRPLFEYDMGQEGFVAGSGKLDTPTKEQAMAAQRKRNMLNGGAENRAPAQSPNGTFFKNISKSAANAVNAINKARFDSVSSRPSSQNRPSRPMRRPSQQLGGSQDSAYAGSSQQSMQSLHSENSFGTSQLDPALRDHSTTYYPNIQSHQQNNDSNEPPRKRMRPSSSQGPHSQPIDGGFDVTMGEMTPPAMSQSFSYAQDNPQSEQMYTSNGLPPLPQPVKSSATEKQQMLTSLFLDPNQNDFSNHPALSHLSGEDLDTPLDQTAHTALHWAATLARIPLLRALINKGASIYRLNGGGETALIRASLTTNNLDQGSFPELLELLGPTIEIRDGRGRTVLHHIAVSSAVKGRSSACRYYLESLLEFVVRQGSAANSQQNSFLEPTIAPAPKSIGLAKFMAEIVNAEDISGDTALNLAARIGNRSITHQLIEVGANPSIPNRGGLKPVDFGVGGDPDVMEPEYDNRIVRTDKHVAGRVAESSQELMSSVSSLLSDTDSSFRSELQTQQSLIDQTHGKLRESTSPLTENRRILAEIQNKSERRKNLRQSITNLHFANDQKRMGLLANHRGGLKTTDIRTDVRIGEADAGLEIEIDTISISTNPSVTQHHKGEYLSTLPAAPILNARAIVYGRHNGGIGSEAKNLQNQSSGLESHLRRVVSLCTGVGEPRVDEMVDGLSIAVASEGGDDVEVGRVREFLRRVEGIADD